MITWNITVTGNQIAIMRDLRYRVYGRQDKRDRHRNPHILVGCRSLIREGLVEHKELKMDSGYVDFTRSGYFLTPRGRFVLRTIEQDIAKFLDPKTARALMADADDAPKPEAKQSLRRVG